MFYPGQRVTCRDGAQYVLAFQRAEQWFGVRVGAGTCCVPLVCEPRYPSWGGNDERAGVDCAQRGGDVRRPLRESPRVA